MHSTGWPKQGPEGLKLFLIPMTLQNVSHLKDPSERVPLGERMPYEEALKLIASGALEGYELKSVEPGIMSLIFFWNTERKVTVRIVEEKPQGILNFSCSHCTENGRSAATCPHQWASFILLWQVTTMEAEDLQHPDLKHLAEEIKGPEFLGAFDNPRYNDPATVGVLLESLSLVLDETPLLKGPALGALLDENFAKYKLIEVEKGKEILSPRLWNLPEVFRKKLTAYSEHYFNEVNKQNRMADMIRYNFSNGQQISAREILRHPLQRMVPGELLPQTKLPTSVFVKWPLIQQAGAGFISQALHELEEIMQALLANVVSYHNRRKIGLYLQTKSPAYKAMKIQAVEFDPVNEVDWRVDFRERKELEAEFKLMSFRKRPLNFYESFAVEPVDGVVLVHPWMRELSQLQETLSGISEDLWLTERQMPTVDLTGELEVKTLLRYLRTRAIPVKVEGESRTLQPHQSLTEIRLQENGSFYIQHQARVNGQKDLVRRGWSTKTVLYLQALSQGLPYLLNVDAKDLATRIRTKREWDMKMLKHLGILQYVLLETLSLHFEGHLTDGSVVKKDALFFFLHPRVQSLLIAGQGGVFVKDLALTELCSRPVLACFEDFVQLTFKALHNSEAFYSEYGEVVLEGVMEREFRLLYEILKKMALVTGGEVFKKSRTSLLSKISNQESGKGQAWSDASFHFPVAEGEKKAGGGVHTALEALQAVIPHGYRIYYKDQPLQELQDDEFHVDFLLQVEGEQKNFNWFELNPKFFLRGEEVDPDKFLSLGSGGVIEYEGKLFLVPQKQMPSLRRLENFWQKLQKGKAENTKRKADDKVYHLPRHQTLELLALRASGVGMRGDEEWDKLCKFYDNLGGASRLLTLPPSMKAELKPYQARGVLWLQDLYQLRLGALLADDMGLGKTLQALAFLDDLREKGEMGQVLIVVPSSLIFNWQSEVEKFTPEIPLEVFSNKEMGRIGRRLEHKEQVVVITTYGLLMEHENFLNQYKWKVLIFDEAQNLKNITTKRTSSARALTAQFKICLTGTPMENHYGEFYSLVDLLVPGSLGKIDDFRRQFVNSEMVTREEMDDLKLKIKPLLLRRTKKEILDQLPEKQETKVSIAFEERQKSIYRDIALSYNQRVQETMAAQGEASVQLQMLTALLRLRQACSDPAALPNVKYEKVPPKLETLMDSVAEIVESGESALVFTQFLQTLERTVGLLKAAGIPVFSLHGGIPTKQRQTLLQQFNNTAGGAVLVMTLKTGGVGLNLTKASYVFHLEPWWNPSVENQATDRAHRIGQNKAVQVFRYIMHESLEEKIELLKDRKDRKFQVLFTNTEKETEVGPGSNALSKADFDLLLGLK